MLKYLIEIKLVMNGSIIVRKQQKNFLSATKFQTSILFKSIVSSCSYNVNENIFQLSAVFAWHWHALLTTNDRSLHANGSEKYF